MLYLFLGKDRFTKQQRLQQLVQLHKADISRVSDSDFNLAALTEPTLFGSSRIFVLDNLLTKLDPETDIAKLVQSPHVIVLQEDSLDKRKKTSNQWLKHPDINLEQFEPPQGPAVVKWVLERAKDLRVAIDKATAEHFVQTVLPPVSTNRFVEPTVDLWQLDSELRKLTTYAAGEPVTKAMVDLLTTKNNEVEAWDITNALGDRNLPQAFLAMEQFFANDSMDEKTKTIQLNALLADQFRNILLVQDFLQHRLPESAILEQTGWKSGRLFIMKKLAAKFQSAQLLSILDKLERLDVELKTTTTPGQTILQLIMAQLA